MKVLVIDDNERNRYLARFLLEQRGHEVLEAEDGEQGLARVASDLPDVVIMDLGLPGIDGLEATRRLRANPATASLPVIACTAHSMVDDEQTALDAGCNGYISKPIDPARFVDQIEAIL